MRSLALVLALVFAAAALPASAQAPAPVQMIRGKIVKHDGDTLRVRTKDGKTADVHLAQNTRIGALAKKKLGDIKNGDFVGVTSVNGKDGKMHAVEVHYLPPTVPESQSPWDLLPGSTMTNAHVSGVVKAKGATDLQVSYKGTPADIVIDRRTAIVGPAPAEASDLKAGRFVVVRATKSPDGMLAAASVTVEKNGVKPPM